jgi:ubiquitin carboxyl-terminal hydrolase 5/13
VHLLTCTKFAPECLMCQVSKLVEGISCGRYSEKKVAKKIEYEGQSEEEKSKVEYTQDGIKPHMFKTLVGRDHNEFKTSRQCDAQEYFAYVLEKLNRMEKAMGNNQHPGNMFDFELESRV